MYVISSAELTDWLIWLVPLDSRKWKLCHYYWKPNKTSLWETRTPVFNGKSISWPHVSGLYHVPHVPGHVPHPMPVTNDQSNVYEHHREPPDWLQMWLCTSRKRCEVLAVCLGVLHDMGGPEPQPRWWRGVLLEWRRECVYYVLPLLFLLSTDHSYECTSNLHQWKQTGTTRHYHR